MNSLDFTPGDDYTEYVIERLGIQRQEEPLYWENGTCYKPKRFQVDYESDNVENIGEILVEYVSNKFSDNVRLVEAAALEYSGSILAVEPSPEFEADLEIVGDVSDLRELLISHSETFPERDGYGYIELEKSLERLPDALSEPGDFFSAFLLDGVTEEDREILHNLYGDGEIEGKVPAFDMELRSRMFVNHNNQIYEVNEQD